MQRNKKNVVTRVFRKDKSSKVVPKAFCFGIFVVNNPLGMVILGGEEVVVDVVVVDVEEDVEEVVEAAAAVIAAEAPVAIGEKISTKGFTGLALIGPFPEFTSSCNNFRYF